MTSRVRASILAITFLALIALPAVAAAQTPVSVSVKGGVNFAKLSFDDDEEEEGLKSRTAAAAGLAVGKAINDMWGWRLEGLFSQKGAKQELGPGIEDAAFKLTYIDVPFLITLSPSSSSSVDFHFYAGPQVSFKTKAEFEFAGETEDADDEVKSTDVGVVVGVAWARDAWALRHDTRWD
jgi:hypothetical protein